jgi:hypothetical protein
MGRRPFRCFPSYTALPFSGATAAPSAVIPVLPHVHAAAAHCAGACAATVVTGELVLCATGRTAPTPAVYAYHAALAGIRLCAPMPSACSAFCFVHSALQTHRVRRFAVTPSSCHTTQCNTPPATVLEACGARRAFAGVTARAPVKALRRRRTRRATDTVPSLSALRFLVCLACLRADALVLGAWCCRVGSRRRDCCAWLYRAPAAGVYGDTDTLQYPHLHNSACGRCRGALTFSPVFRMLFCDHLL